MFHTFLIQPKVQLSLFLSLSHVLLTEELGGGGGGGELVVDQIDGVLFSSARSIASDQPPKHLHIRLEEA